MNTTAISTRTYGQLELIPTATTSASAYAGRLDRSLFFRWLAFVDAADKTRQTYERAIRQFSAWLEGRGIFRPERQDILDYKRYLDESGHKPTTINLYLTAVSRFFKWAEVEGLYKNITREIKRMKTNTKPKGYLTIDQIKDLLLTLDRSTITGKRDYAILRLMLTAGLRTIEVSRADIEDIHQRGNKVYIYIQGKGRTDKCEMVELAPQVEKAIREYLAARKETDPKAPLFVSASNNSIGYRLTSRTISNIAKNAMKAIGFDDEQHTAHSCRYTAITQYLLAGHTPQEAQAIARHRHLDTTMIYARNLDREKLTCVSDLDNAIGEL